MLAVVALCLLVSGCARNQHSQAFENASTPSDSFSNDTLNDQPEISSYDSYIAIDPAAESLPGVRHSDNEEGAVENLATGGFFSNGWIVHGVCTGIYEDGTIAELEISNRTNPDYAFYLKDRIYVEIPENLRYLADDALEHEVEIHFLPHPSSNGPIEVWYFYVFP